MTSVVSALSTNVVSHASSIKTLEEPLLHILIPLNVDHLMEVMIKKVHSIHCN